jgi:DNA-binding transcriptional regulator YhcF (GntR family)
MTEQQANYVTEAMELLSAEPAAIIEQPRSRLVMRDGIGEEWTVAWVKLSTAFKPHIKEIRGAPLAVWLYVALSVNKQGVSFPSIDKMAEDTGYSRNGVMDAIKILEEKGYMKVRRGEKRYNLYEPEFAAIGKNKEPSDESTQFTGLLSQSNESTFSPDQSSVVDSNKRNKIKQDMPLDWKLGHGEEVTQKDVDVAYLRNLAPKMFEKALGFSKPLPWWNGKEWTAFAEWVCEHEKEDKKIFGEYNIWRNTQYTKGGMANPRIRGFVTEFYDSWDMFMMSRKPAEVYAGDKKIHAL